MAEKSKPSFWFLTEKKLNPFCFSTLFVSENIKRRSSREKRMLKSICEYAASKWPSGNGSGFLTSKNCGFIGRLFSFVILSNIWIWSLLQFYPNSARHHHFSIVHHLRCRNTHDLDFDGQMLQIVGDILSKTREFSNLSLMIQMKGVNPALQL